MYFYLFLQSNAALKSDEDTRERERERKGKLLNWFGSLAKNMSKIFEY